MKKLFLLLMMMSALNGFSQTKQTTHLEQFWTGYFNQTRFSKRWGLWFDIQLRTKDDFVKDLSQLLVRPGLMYYLNDNTKLTAAYGFMRLYPLTEAQTVTQTEHRPWQQIQWQTKYKRVKTSQYFRLEERFRRKLESNTSLGKGYDFNFRTRYNFSLQVPITKGETRKGSLSAIFNDELFINFGKDIIYNYFDQNRAFFGAAYHPNAKDQLQFGYMYLFQQLPAGNRYRGNHIARVVFFHNLDLRSKN